MNADPVQTTQGLFEAFARMPRRLGHDVKWEHHPPVPCGAHRWHNGVSTSSVYPLEDWCVVCGALRMDPRKQALGLASWRWFPSMEPKRGDATR